MPPTPKRPDQRQRRNRTANAATLEAGPVTRAALPARYSMMRCADCELPAWFHNRDGFEKNEVYVHEFAPAEIAWRPLTLAWWSTIWASPMADEWVDADVPGLMALAALVDQFWTLGESKVAAEIRMQQREYGLSPLSRRQLQWEVKRLEAVKTPELKPAAPRRRGGIVGVLQGGRVAG